MTHADEQVAELVAAARRITSYFQSLECYQVEVSQAWELKGLDERRGTNELNAMTESSVHFSGLDVLSRDDSHRYIMGLSSAI